MSIESIALGWMRARLEREQLQQQRDSLLCEHERGGALIVGLVQDGPAADGDARPCWKTKCIGADDNGTAYYRQHRSPMCPACTKRQELHVQLRGARAREGARRGALTRACRRRLCLGQHPTPTP